MSGPVVVGVSPNTGSPAALRWAAEEAGLRGVTLRAVMAWRPPPPPGAPGGRPPTASPPPTPQQYARNAEETLRGFVATALGSSDGVQCEVVKGSAVNALLTAARDAQLLVIGEPRPGRISNVRSGVVAPQVVLKAHCPVVVMPTAATLAG
jgi:nucleotide-binding universal stress UspA family protein